jgi:hypothetical protein
MSPRAHHRDTGESIESHLLESFAIVASLPFGDSNVIDGPVKGSFLPGRRIRFASPPDQRLCAYDMSGTSWEWKDYAKCLWVAKSQKRGSGCPRIPHSWRFWAYGTRCSWRMSGWNGPCLRLSPCGTSYTAETRPPWSGIAWGPPPTDGRNGRTCM